MQLLAIGPSGREQQATTGYFFVPDGRQAVCDWWRLFANVSRESAGWPVQAAESRESRHLDRLDLETWVEELVDGVGELACTGRSVVSNSASCFMMAYDAEGTGGERRQQFLTVSDADVGQELEAAVRAHPLLGGPDGIDQGLQRQAVQPAAQEALERCTVQDPTGVRSLLLPLQPANRG